MFDAGTCKLSVADVETTVDASGDAALIFTATLLLRLSVNEPKYANMNILPMKGSLYKRSRHKETD